MSPAPQSGKRKRFDYERTKAEGTSPKREVRKKLFLDYFNDFKELPSFLFDNEAGIDPQLMETIQDLLDDPGTTKEMRDGIDALLRRMPL